MPKNFKFKYPVYISLIILICITSSGWFRKIFFENITLSVIFLVTTIVVIVLLTIGKSKLLQNLALIFFGLLTVYQFNTTKIFNTYSITPVEKDLEISRMNYYPPRQARLGYILETKREVKIVDKFIDNFIESVDINTYFPDYFSFIFLPFFFVGIFYYVKNSFEKDYKMKISYTVLFTIFILSLVGVNGKYGPFILFPFIVFFIYIGLIRVFNLISFLV